MASFSKLKNIKKCIQSNDENIKTTIFPRAFSAIAISTRTGGKAFYLHIEKCCHSILKLEMCRNMFDVQLHSVEIS